MNFILDWRVNYNVCPPMESGKEIPCGFSHQFSSLIDQADRHKSQHVYGIIDGQSSDQ